MTDLVRNARDRFSRGMAQISLVMGKSVNNQVRHKSTCQDIEFWKFSNNKNRRIMVLYFLFTKNIYFQTPMCSHLEKIYV